MRRGPLVAALIFPGLVTAFAGCSPGPVLPTVEAMAGMPLLCPAGAYEPFWLRIQDGEVFGEWQANNERFELRWPPGFWLGGDAARAVVHDPDGRIVAHDDQLITDAGGADGVICGIGGRPYDLNAAR